MPTTTRPASPEEANLPGAPAPDHGVLPVDAILPVDDVAAIGSAARRLEAAGYARLHVAEAAHDAFVAAAVVSQHTRRAELATDVAIAFARSPMTVAYSAWDLQRLSGGRFTLGLGSQVRAHIVRRFSMPWSSPARRMREYVLALRAIWQAWERGEPTAFEGEFYRHTLVGPPFSPGPHPDGLPAVMVAGVGPQMVEVAGEVADGLLVHPFHTPGVLADTVLPALARGRAASTRAGVPGTPPFEVVAQLMVATGTTPAAVDAARESARARVAFYGSTPAYREVVGDVDLHERLHALSRAGRWDAMTALVPDEVLDQVVVIGPPGEAAAAALARVRGWATRLVLLPADDVARRPSAGDGTVAWYEDLAAALALEPPADGG